MRRLIKSKDNFITCPLEDLSLRTVLGECFVLKDDEVIVSDPLYKVIPSTPDVLEDELTPLDIDLFICGGYAHGRRRSIKNPILQ